MTRKRSLVAPTVVAEQAPIKAGANHDFLSEMESKMSVIRGTSDFERIADSEALGIGQGGTVVFSVQS